jgi:phage repressor protein C with HTH and peptisase S24 domain
MNYDKYREELESNRVVQFRPKGNSMRPRILSNQLITVSPNTSDISVDDIVFCKVRGHYYVHLVTAIDKKNSRYQISNNSGYVNGWTKSIYGKVIRVED